VASSNESAEPRKHKFTGWADLMSAIEALTTGSQR